MARYEKPELNNSNLAVAYHQFSSLSQNEASIERRKELAQAWADTSRMTS